MEWSSIPSDPFTGLDSLPIPSAFAPPPPPRASTLPLETDHFNEAGKADATVAELKLALKNKGVKSSFSHKTELLVACKQAKIKFALSARGQAAFAAKKQEAKDKAAAAKHKEKEKVLKAKEKEAVAKKAAQDKEKEAAAEARRRKKEDAQKAKESEAAAKKAAKERETAAKKAAKDKEKGDAAAARQKKRALSAVAPAAKKARPSVSGGGFRATMASLPAGSQPELREVSRGSSTWLRCEALAKLKLQAVHEVINPYLWRLFDAQCTNLRHKNRGADNVKQLFHGTSGYDARALCLGQSGFDPRVSSPGFYGEGSYFAEKASYSQHYASKAPSNAPAPYAGRQQMIIADVAVGDAYDYKKAIDRSLRRPPQKAPDAAGAPVEIEFQDSPLYDSVKGGPHGGSCMYVVYLPAQAYPRYLLTL